MLYIAQTSAPMAPKAAKGSSTRSRQTAKQVATVAGALSKTPTLNFGDGPQDAQKAFLGYGALNLVQDNAFNPDASNVSLALCGPNTIHVLLTKRTLIH